MFNKKQSKDKVWDEIQKRFQTLNRYEQAELLLSFAFTNVNMEMVETGVGMFIGWHEKQHPAFDTCPHCERAKELAIMYNMVKMYFDVQKNWAGQ